jgi:hypothetical protein
MDNLLENKVESLPEDITKYIYYQYIHNGYIEVEFFYERFYIALCTERSKSLDIVDIYPYIPLILANPQYIKYFSEKMKFFRRIYIGHKQGEKNFTKLNNGESFALCILMYSYH